MFFFKKTDFTVYCLYKYDNDGFIQNEFIQSVVDFFELNYDLHFKCLLYDDIKFSNNSIYDFNKGIDLLNKKKWDRIVSIDLFEKNILKERSAFSFSFAKVNNPSFITIKIPKSLKFDIVSFLELIRNQFSPIYGLMYYVENKENDTKYVYSNYPNLPKCEGIGRLGNNDKMRYVKGHKMIEKGFFRDVYYWNLLSQYHIENKIADTTVGRLIESRSIGKLVNIYDNIFTWELNESQLKVARDLFYNSSLMI